MKTDSFPYAFFQGKIVQIEKRPTDDRITFDNLKFENWPGDQPQPWRVRLTSRQKGTQLNLGDIVMAKAVLLPAIGHKYG